MTLSIRTYAKYVYEEFIEYTIDYIENEIDFETALINLEIIKDKLYQRDIDAEGQLLISEYETMESILTLFLIASIEIHEGKKDSELLELSLIQKLIELIDKQDEDAPKENLGGIINERRKN